MAIPMRKTHFLIPLLASWIDALKRALATGEGGGAVSGTSGATTPSFTGTAPVAAENLASPFKSGTGFATVGQVTTTTDSQTMTLNQCAGMWFVPATQPPCLIASNTAVTGAPAVLTLYGGAPTTNSGTYKILTGMTPVGAAGSHTHAAGSFAAAPAGGGYFHFDVGEYPITAPTAVDLPTSQAVLYAVVVWFYNHVGTTGDVGSGDALAHVTIDTTNQLTGTLQTLLAVVTPSAAPTLATLITAANAYKASFNAHLTQSGVHDNNDGTNTVVASNATDLPSLETLCNAIAASCTAHSNNGATPASWRPIPA